MRSLSLSLLCDFIKDSFHAGFLRLFCLLVRSMVAASCEESITVAKWGSIEGRSIEKYTLKNKSGQEVDIITYGATITSVRTPDKHGNIADVVLGYDNIEGIV